MVFCLSDVSGILTVDLHGKMDEICSAVCIWRSHPKYAEDHLLRHCWTRSVFTLEELALLLLYCYWSTKKAGAHPQVSSFVHHCWRIHIYQSPAKLSIHLTASSLVGWVGDFGWEHRQYFGSGFCSFLLPWIKQRPLILVSFQNWKNCFLQKYKIYYYL